MSEDPFFELSGDSTWNACIGSQGDELHYVDGYIEAAWELANAIIEKKMLGKRDTLVLPILYNARHAVELILKYVVGQLAAFGAIPSGHPVNHDIQSHYDFLVAGDVGDEKIRQHLQALRPFVESLARIDDDGQELRYHVNRKGETSLKGESLANIGVIRDSLKQLNELIEAFKNRTIDFVDECAGKAHTPRCSRSDLVSIAKMMPALSEWRSDAFIIAKEAVKERFRLSNKQFAKAIDAIKTSREMMGMLGAETELPNLTDEEILLVVREWRKLHPPPADRKPRIILGSDIKAEDLIKHSKELRAATKSLSAVIRREEAADLEALFYLGRDGWFPELFDEKAARIRERLGDDENLAEQIARLLDKKNLLQCLQKGARRAGRLALADTLANSIAEHFGGPDDELSSAAK
ncbi:hypothetical protein [Bradyrhizobium sp. B117]|uniref:hypothetical protein n=1 Tax=Bradyrhizobium sp. B117 TaxID=3140246 RepID=UPI0031845853